jgi:hypothetical protein
MDAQDRLRSIASQLDEDRRFDEYTDLGEDISNEAAAPLSDGERAMLVRLLTSEAHSPSLNRLWYLAHISGRDDRLRDSALRALATRGHHQRAGALRYLRLFYPELMPLMADQYGSDLDPGVKVELALDQLPRDRDAAVRRLIDAVADAPPALGDEIWRYIHEYGDQSHVEPLLERDRAAGGNTLYGTIARSLRERPASGSPPDSSEPEE